MAASRIEQLALIFISTVAFAASLAILMSLSGATSLVGAFVVRAAKFAFTSASSAASSAIEGLMSSLSEWF